MCVLFMVINSGTSYSNLQCICVLIGHLRSSGSQHQVLSEALEAARLEDPRPSGAIPKSNRPTPAEPIPAGRKTRGKFDVHINYSRKK